MSAVAAISSGSVKRGGGCFNSMINALPFELHTPGYQFCGPGTKLQKRLARGDQGINPLDAACRDHDIAYSRSNNLAERHAADKILARKARGRVIASDSTLSEKAAATTVWAAMNAKRKMGMGLKTKMKTKAKKNTKKNGYFQRRNEAVCYRFYRYWELLVLWLVEQLVLPRS